MFKIKNHLFCAVVLMVSYLSVIGQHNFPNVVGPINVPQSAAANLNINDNANSDGVPCTDYNFITINVDWVAGNGGPWSSEAGILVNYAGGSTLIGAPTSGGASNSNSTSLSFTALLSPAYSPCSDGSLDLVLSQTYLGSDANWSNISASVEEVIIGCTDPNSANYNPNAILDDGSCLNPPSNDDCATPTPLATNVFNCDGTFTNGTDNGATFGPEGGESCGAVEGDVWFSVLVPTPAVNLTVSTDFAGGTHTNTVVAVYRGSCVNLSELECNDDNPFIGSNTGLSLLQISNDVLIAGETLLIQVARGVGTAPGTFCIQADFAIPPDNDLCGNAFALTPSIQNCNGSLINGTTEGATVVGNVNPTCFYSPATADVWYTVLVPDPPLPLLVSIDMGFTLVNAQAAIYQGQECGTISLVNPLGCGELNYANEFLPIMNVPSGELVGGETLWIRVDHNGYPGPGSFCIQADFGLGCTDPTATNYDPAATTDDGSCVFPPPNDDCSSPTALVPNSGFCDGTATNGTSIGATIGPEGNDNCFSGIQGDVWFSIEVPTPALNLTVSTESNGGTQGSTDFTVYRGACGVEIAIGCDYTDRLEINKSLLVAGETLLILADPYASTTPGTFCIQADFGLGCTDPLATNYDPSATQENGTCFFQPDNDDCFNAIPLAPNSSYCDGTTVNGTDVDAFTTEHGTPNCFLSGVDANVWYIVEVPNPPLNLVVSTDFLGGTHTDTEIAVYRGSCNFFSLLGCNDDVNDFNSMSAVEISASSLVGGEILYIQVDRAGSAVPGTFCIQADFGRGCTDPAAINYEPSALLDDGSCFFTPRMFVDGELYLERIASGAILRSPDGTCWRLTVDDYGVMKTKSVPCP